MSDGDGAWPANPHDPECPACGGPVSAWADYCMHCETDLPAADPGAVGTGGDPGATGTAADSGSPGAAPGAGTAVGVEDVGLLHPDGLLDDSLTVVVGAVAGFLAGILATALVAFPLPGGWPFLIGFATWLLATAALVRKRTVVGAVHHGALLLAALLALLPVVVAATAPMAAGASGDRVGLALVLAVFAWPVAGVLAVVGWLAGRGD